MRLKGKVIHNFPSKYIYYIFDYTTTNKWRQVFDAISDCRKSPVKPGFFVVCGGKKWYNVDKEKARRLKKCCTKKVK